MRKIEPLSSDVLYWKCDPHRFPFKTTDDLEPTTNAIGQPRAVEAVRSGIDIRQEGYNLFALGPAGLGKHKIVRRFLDEQAATETPPVDWCYVNNFAQPQEPSAIKLPSGQAVLFRDDMAHLVEELRSTIPAEFESDSYRARKQEIETEIKNQQAKLFEDLETFAKGQNIAVGRTPVGFVLAPVKDGEVLSPEQFQALPEEEHKRAEAAIATVHDQLHVVMDEILQLEKIGRERLKSLNHEVTISAVGHLIEALRTKYKDLAEVVSYLDTLRRDVIESADQFLTPPDSPVAALISASQIRDGDSAFLRRYRVNVITDHGAAKGAPVIYEDNPTYQNLIGDVEYVSQMGALSTDFNLIRGGALHRANGGYLMLDAAKVLSYPYAWEGLKRALTASEIRIESLGQALGFVSTFSLKPKPIPLDIKIVLIGERILYYLLSQYDPEFSALFKVSVDFEDQMERSSDSDLLYARLIATMTKSEGLLPFDACAVARLIEQSSRLAGDAEKLSTRQMTIRDLLRESDYWARKAGHKSVCAADVQQAINSQQYRATRVQERVLEEIRRGTILIDTEGMKIGQVNGLSVVQLGQFTFGQPTRITARVRLGRGDIVDIEREVELGGPIHSKGVFILSGFLGSRYAAEWPLSLHATLVFEQSYGGVEGDSASCAELYALLSALADVPLRQAIAVTGSVNQHGQVQPIGGVNEKIEGFFDTCVAKGLTGEQGVIIPAANKKNLMLRHDVVEAVIAGQFRVFAVETIDEGIEILSGMAAGERDETGEFPRETVNHRVERRLIALAQKRMAFAAAASEGGTGERK